MPVSMLKVSLQPGLYTSLLLAVFLSSFYQGVHILIFFSATDQSSSIRLLVGFLACRWFTSAKLLTLHLKPQSGGPGFVIKV